MKGSLNINVHLPRKIILVVLNLVHTFFANIFFDSNYGVHPE